MLNLTLNKQPHTLKNLTLTSILTLTSLLTACQTPIIPNNQKPQPEPTTTNFILGEAQTLTILANRIPCQSELPMQCLLVQPNNEQTLQLPYNAITGFEPQQGIEYQILARPHLNPNNSNDSFAKHWTLVNILMQQPK